MNPNPKLLIISLTMGLSLPAVAEVIDFDSQGLSGPSLFADASPSPQTIVIPTSSGNVTFSGGVILTKTANMPANQTSIYGTANFRAGLLNPMSITFSFANPIQNFFMDLYNGETTPASYRVADDVGNSAEFTLASNLSSGTTLVGFAASGNVVTVTALPATTQTWDFFVDNIHFNEALPDLGVPDVGASFSLMLMGLGVLTMASRKLK